MSTSKGRLLQKWLHWLEFAFKMLTLFFLILSVGFGLRVFAPISSQAEATERTTFFETYTSTVTESLNSTTSARACPVANGTTVNCNIAVSITDHNVIQDTITGTHGYVISPSLSVASQAAQTFFEELAILSFALSLVLDVCFWLLVEPRKSLLRRILLGT